VILATNPLDINNITTALQNKMEPFTSRGSERNVSKIHNLSLCIWSFRPVAGSSFIPTPAKIQNKKAVINTRNHTSNDCFQHFVLAAIHPASNNPTLLSTYNKFTKKLNMTGIETPVALSLIPKLTNLS